MATKSPLALVKEGFGDKSKLVEAVEKLTTGDLWVARVNEAKGLAHVSNAKLLRLHAIFAEVKEKFGTREKLIDAIVELEKRSKDAGFRQRLSAWPVPRLYDAYRSTSKRVVGRSDRGTKGQVKADGSALPKAAAAKKAAKKVAPKRAAKGVKKGATKAMKPKKGARK
jgi:hypothetical protein